MVLTIVVFCVTMSQLERLQVTKHDLKLEYQLSHEYFQNRHGILTLNAAVIIAYVISLVQMLLHIITTKFMLDQVMTGLSWGDKMTKSHSKNYFLVACCITVPIIVYYCACSLTNSYTQYKGLPEISDQFFSSVQKNFTIACLALSLVLSIFGYVIVASKN